MKRNKNVDILRAIAIIIIVVYHCYALAGYPWGSQHVKLNALLGFGGEVGVTLFFMLSGFGICCSLMKKEQTVGLPTWGKFMKQRCLRIMPQYYCCLGFLLLFQSYGKLGKEGIKHIISYVLFLQNFSVETHGSINGALWAMATIFQFYLFAILLYKIVRKNWAIAAVASVLISVVSKMILYHWVFVPQQAEASYYFVFGRQLLTALDNFVLGMVAAKIVSQITGNEKRKLKYTVCSFAVLAVTVGIVLLSYYLSVKGVYTDSLRGYLGHSAMAILMMLLIIFVSFLPQCEGILMRPFHALAKYQYGMYLWHMPILGNLINGAPFFQGMAVNHFVLLAILMVILTAVIGYLSAIWVDSVDYSAWFKWGKNRSAI